MDNLTINTHLSRLAGIGQLNAKPELPSIPQGQLGGEMTISGTQETQGANFSQMLTESIDKVNQSLLASDKAVEDLATGKSTNVHGTLIAMQKADISFKMFLEVRSKVMAAMKK